MYAYVYAFKSLYIHIWQDVRFVAGPGCNSMLVFFFLAHAHTTYTSHTYMYGRFLYMYIWYIMYSNIVHAIHTQGRVFICTTCVYIQYIYVGIYLYIHVYIYIYIHGLPLFVCTPFLGTHIMHICICVYVYM